LMLTILVGMLKQTATISLMLLMSYDPLWLCKNTSCCFCSKNLMFVFITCVICSDARVMWDHKTGRSKGYGFVSFRNQQVLFPVISSCWIKLVIQFNKSPRKWTEMN
jgi:hypothetical protein